MKLDQGFRSPNRNGTNGPLHEKQMARRYVRHCSVARSCVRNTTEQTPNLKTFGIKSALIRQLPLGGDRFRDGGEDLGSGSHGGAATAAMFLRREHRWREHDSFESIRHNLKFWWEGGARRWPHAAGDGIYFPCFFTSSGQCCSAFATLPLKSALNFFRMSAFKFR